MSYRVETIQLNGMDISSRVEKLNFTGVAVTETSDHHVTVAFNTLLNNYAAIVNPTIADDSADGYSAGSIWINTTTDAVYTLVDAAVGSAVWVESSLTAADLATVAVTGDYSDLINSPTLFTDVTDGVNTMTSAGGTTITLAAGTDMDITVNPATNTATFDWIGAHPAAQNVWNNIALSGNTIGDTLLTADSATDTLNLVAGTGVTLTGVAGSDSITISAVGGGTDQDLFASIITDDLTTLTAATPTDQLTITGGAGVTTTILGGELVINGLTTSGTANEIAVSTAGTIETVGIADNPILPGTGSVIPPSGTTVQRPVSPADGMVRYNTDLECLEVYSTTSVAWACFNSGADLTGSSFTLMFAGDGTVRNSWLDHGANNVITDSTFAIIPFDCVLSAVTYSNSKTTTNLTLEIYSAPENTLTQTLKFSWPLPGVRSARNSNIASIPFSAGDKLGIYSRDGGTAGNDVVVNCFFQISTVSASSNTDTTPGTFNA